MTTQTDTVAALTRSWEIHSTYLTALGLFVLFYVVCTLQDAAERTWFAAEAGRRAAVTPWAAAHASEPHASGSSAATAGSPIGSGTGLTISLPAAAGELNTTPTSHAAPLPAAASTSASVTVVPTSPRAERAAASAKSPMHAPPAIKPVVLTFSGISYFVNTKAGEKQLLRNVSGFALPGTVTALCGSSGAGKTTLLDGE